MKTITSILFIFMFTACTSNFAISVAEIKQGKHLNRASKSHTGQYFTVFAVPDESSRWETLYSDSANIYFGRVKNKNFLSRKKVVEYLYRIPHAEMEQDIPFYKNGNLCQTVTDSIDVYCRKYYGHKGSYVQPTAADLILRGDSINYQIEANYYWYHFEAGKQKGKILVLLDKRINVIETFYLNSK